MGRRAYNPEFARARADCGGHGIEYIADTNEHTPVASQGLLATDSSYRKIVMVTATVFAALTPETGSPITGTITGVTFPVGFVLEGSFTMIDLTSGSVVAYVGPKLFD